MTKQKFTPAPWKIHPFLMDNIHRIYHENLTICDIHNNGNYDVSIKNANLIAAAPELYESLDMLLDGLKTYAPDYMHAIPKSEYIDKARKALATANGESF